MERPIRKTDLRSNSFESFARVKQQQPILRNRRASISSYPERTRSPSICLSDDSWVYSPQQKVEWVDETKVNDCRGCHKPFSMIVRKHHCRNCGDVFCGTCSSFKILLPSYSERQRVCVNCVTLLASDAPPRSPDAPGYPSELAVNTSLPDDLDDLFDEIIENDEDYQKNPVMKPRRAVSSISRPPRKLFSSGLPMPPADQDGEVEQQTTITFGTEQFNKTVSALATISENQLNANRERKGSFDGEGQVRKKSFSSLRPPRKSFSGSSPLKSKPGLIESGDIENIHPNLDNIAVFHAETAAPAAIPAAPPVLEPPLDSVPTAPLASPSGSGKDCFHTMSPIAPNSPVTTKDHYCETIEAFTPAGKVAVLSTLTSARKSPLIKNSPAEPLKTISLSDIETIDVVEVVGTSDKMSDDVVQFKIASKRSLLAIVVSLFVLLVMGATSYCMSGAPAQISKIELKTMSQAEFEATSAHNMLNQAVARPQSGDTDDFVTKVPQKKSSEPTIRKGSSVIDFGMYDDVVDISGMEIPSMARRAGPVDGGSPRHSFGPRASSSSSMAVFKKRTYQMFSDSIQSHTVNNFVNMLRELYRRIKELNLLKRLDHFIRGVVLSAVNSGQERIPAQTI